MSTTQSNPLVEALQRKTNYQAERIDELEETITELEADLEMVLAEMAEEEQ